MKYEITTDGTAKGTVVKIDGKPIEQTIRQASASMKKTPRETVVNVVVWAGP